MFDNFSPHQISLPPTKIMGKKLTTKRKTHEPLDPKIEKAKLIIYQNSSISDSNTISSLIKSYYNGCTYSKPKSTPVEHPRFHFEYEYKAWGQLKEKQQPKSKSNKIKIDDSSRTNSLKISVQLENKSEQKKIQKCYINRTNFNFNIKEKKIFLSVNRSPPTIKSRSIQLKQKRNNLWIRRKKSSKIISLIEKKKQPMKTQIREVTPWSPRRKLIWKTEPDQEIEESHFYLPIY